MLVFIFLALVLLLFVVVILANMVIEQIVTDLPALISAASERSVVRSISLSLCG